MDRAEDRTAVKIHGTLSAAQMDIQFAGREVECRGRKRREQEKEDQSRTAHARRKCYQPVLGCGNSMTLLCRRAAHMSVAVATNSAMNGSRSMKFLVVRAVRTMTTGRGRRSLSRSIRS